MASTLPKYVIVSPNHVLRVVEKNLGDALGYFDPKTGEIAINSSQHPVGKHHILLHEPIHIAIEKIKQTGLIKRSPSERFVTYLTGALFPILAVSGLWTGVTPEEAAEFTDTYTEEE